MVTPDRRRMFYVSEPWWFAELSLLARTADVPVNLAGKRLALASPIYRFLAEKNFPGALQVPFSDATDAAVAMCQGKADAALMMHMDVHEIFLARPDVCQDAGVSVTETSATMELAIIARRGMESQAGRLRKRIDEMALDGTLARLAARYPTMPSSGVVKLADDLRARYSRRLWRTIAIFAVLMLAAGVWFIRRLYQDIRERQRAQTELELSQARLARAHRIALLADWEIDLGSGELDLSKDARELLGCNDPANFNGWKTFLGCVTADDLERVRGAFEQAAGGKPVDVYYGIQHPETGRRYLRQHAEPVIEGSRVIKLVGTIQDMTAHRQLEQQLSQAQKMESVGQLAGGVAHDFNNLLTVISGHAAMLLEVLPLHDESRESVEEIAQAADRAAALTRQLVTFSRRQIIQPRIISLNELLRNLEKMLRRLIGEDIELVLSLDPEGASICADTGQIEQVVVNLVVNARDAMPKGGKLVIRTAKCRRIEGESVQLTVADTGTGIPSEALPRIFEPFFTTKERGKGTGLGLSMVYGFVNQSGGSINVHSQAGSGTTFEVLLPAAGSVPGPEPETVAEPASASGCETILVAEDEAGVRRFIREVLRGRGYRVLEAGNGREALRLAENHTGVIDLLLTDLVMPEIGGVDLANRFAELRPAAAIVYMSGYTDRDVRREILEKLLRKPFTPPVLLSRIRESLAARRLKRTGSAGAPHV
jgi:signal transduction histidine kinase